MKVILTKDVEKTGKAGDVVKVKDGFGLNFLIPRGLAVEAGKGNLKFLENEKKKLESKEKKQKHDAEAMREKLENISCTITMSAGEGDKLFGEVTPEMISDCYRREGLTIEKKKIHLEKPIRHLGVYQAEIKLHPDVVTTVKIWVVKK